MRRPARVEDVGVAPISGVRANSCDEGVDGNESATNVCSGRHIAHPSFIGVWLL